MTKATKRSAGRPKVGPHIFTRNGRHYADVRDFAAVLDDGEKSGRIALVAKDEKLATRDPEIAQVLFARKVEELRERSRTKVSTGRWKSALLKQFAARHLELKAKSGQFTEQWLGAVQLHLDTAIDFFGAQRDLASISTSDVALYVDHLAQMASGRKANDKLSPASQRKYLNSLSNLYRRAASEGHVPPGMNPVAALMEKPSGATSSEAKWLEVPDAALLLEACRLYQPIEHAHVKSMPASQLHAIVGTLLLTGGRESEVAGLLIGDVSFERGRVTYRPHPHRRLKTKTSWRSVPLWPQLRAILVPYIATLEDQGPEGLLFPSVRGTGMVTDIRKALDTAAASVGWKAGEIRTKMFRHSYCSARLQTLDNGAPVSQFTVAGEMGHGGLELVKKVYGHLGEIRHRSEQVEYLIENHAEQLAQRLRLIMAA